jgi:hypothetical protein
VILASGLTLWGVSQLPRDKGTGQSAKPSETAASSVGLPESPTPSSEPPTPVHAFVEVTGGELAAFDEPSVTSLVVDRLAEGRAVWAESRLDLPDGAWIRVQFASFAHGGQEIFAWVQGDTLAAVELSCPPRPEVAALGAMTGQERLLCFGGDELRIVGFAIGLDPQSPAFNGSPEWLAEGPSFGLRGSAEAAADTGLIGGHVDPEAGLEVPRDTWVEVVGHFDDPKSSTCMREPATSGVTEETPAEQRLYCRQRFVLSQVMVVDPPVLPTPAPDPST